jgi:hypothetical protein
MDGVTWDMSKTKTEPRQSTNQNGRKNKKRTTNKQTSKQANKQTNKQASKQAPTNKPKQKQQTKSFQPLQRTSPPSGASTCMRESAGPDAPSSIGATLWMRCRGKARENHSALVGESEMNRYNKAKTIGKQTKIEL